MSQYSANPSKEHLDKALYICRYLIGSRNYALVYNGNTMKGLEAYTDSDWAGDPDDRRSITGYFFNLANGIISWQSRAQKTIALSSTQAEYMALSDCSRQAVWIRNLLMEIAKPVSAIPIYGDNQGSLFLAGNEAQEKRSKHIDIRFHFIREQVQSGTVKLFFVEGSKNPADMFTKNLGHIKFYTFRRHLGIEFYDSSK